jgi:hypothetical protein
VGLNLNDDQEVGKIRKKERYAEHVKGVLMEGG